MSATGLKTLDTLGTTHDEQERAVLRQEYESTNQGTIYPALVRLQQRDWITSHWGESDNSAARNSTSSRESGGDISPPKSRNGSASRGL
jgi:DNA-binding PadR family transcriptional regulator